MGVSWDLLGWLVVSFGGDWVVGFGVLGKWKWGYGCRRGGCGRMKVGESIALFFF